MDRRRRPYRRPFRRPWVSTPAVTGQRPSAAPGAAKSFRAQVRQSGAACSAARRKVSELERHGFAEARAESSRALGFWQALAPELEKEDLPATRSVHRERAAQAAREASPGAQEAEAALAALEAAPGTRAAVPDRAPAPVGQVDRREAPVQLRAALRAGRARARRMGTGCPATVGRAHAWDRRSSRRAIIRDRQADRARVPRDTVSGQQNPSALRSDFLERQRRHHGSIRNSLDMSHYPGEVVCRSSTALQMLRASMIALAHVVSACSDAKVATPVPADGGGNRSLRRVRSAALLS